MDFIIEWIKLQFVSNDIFAGVMGGAMVAPILYSLRNIPNKIWALILRYYTVKIVIRGTDKFYPVLDEWLSTLDYTKKTKRLTVIRKISDGSNNCNEDIYELVPGFGTHIFRLGFSFYLLTKVEETEGNGVFESRKAKETITITTLGRSQEKIKKIIELAVINQTKRKGKVQLFIWVNWWNSIGFRSKRQMDTIILKENQKNKIITDINKFLISREQYINLGIPYRRGYLFSGPPGTGKSSFVTALASWFDFPVYIMNLKSISDDNALQTAFSDIPSKSLILLEDVDAVSINNSRKPKKIGVIKNEDESYGVSLSGLLNAIDGLVAAEGRILIMTTNYPEKLDNALIRPGRVDIHERFEKAGKEEVISFIERFFNKITPTQVEKILLKEKISHASIQQACMLNNNVDEVIEYINHLSNLDEN